MGDVMIDKIVPLNSVKIGESVKVKNLNSVGDIRRRMLDLGIVNNTKIKPVLKSPSGDPVAYEIRGAIIALRKEDADLIMVSV